ncbi:DNA polymerase III subunit gamma/tau, partial [Paenibacillus sp. EKM208P]
PGEAGAVVQPAAQRSGAAAEQEDVVMLKRQLAELEKKLERALQGGLGAGAGQEASSGGRQASGGRAPAPRISAPAKL